MADQVTGTPTDPGAPSPSQPPDAPPAPAADPTPPADPSAPPAPPAPPAEPDPLEALPVVPDDVPYQRFRQTEMERTQARREAARLQTERDELRGRLEAIEAARQKEIEDLADMRAVQEAIRQKPELYEYIERELLAAQNAGGAPTPAGAPAPALPPELLAQLKETTDFIAQEKAARERAVQDERIRADLGRLETEVRTQLDRVKLFRPEAYNEIVPEAMQWIVRQAMRDNPEGDPTAHIPHYFNQWARKQYALARSVNATAVAGHRQDAQVVPPPIGAGAPVVEADKVPALNTPEFHEYVRAHQAQAGGLG